MNIIKLKIKFNNIISKISKFFEVKELVRPDFSILPKRIVDGKLWSFNECSIVFAYKYKTYVNYDFREQRINTILVSKNNNFINVINNCFGIVKFESLSKDDAIKKIIEFLEYQDALIGDEILENNLDKYYTIPEA